MPGALLVVRRADDRDDDAKCNAQFRNGPEAPRTRSAELKAGESVTQTVKFARNIIRLRVNVTCQPK